jgi:V8-like Glu-specific endopeptidase
VRHLLVLAIASLPIATGCDALDASDDARADATPSATTRAVGHVSGAFECSGTLVHPDRVLTAQHCADGANAFTVDLGDGATLTRGVGGWLGVPGFVLGDRLSEDDVERDLALLRLDPYDPASRPQQEEAARWATLRPIPLASTARVVDEPVRIVGYGEHAPGVGDEGLQHAVTSRIVDVSPTHATFLFGDGLSVVACGGDSGGAILARRAAADGTRVTELVGVLSSGSADCLWGKAVDLHEQRGWIAEAHATFDR